MISLRMRNGKPTKKAFSEFLISRNVYFGYFSQITGEVAYLWTNSKDRNRAMKAIYEELLESGYSVSFDPSDDQLRTGKLRFL